MLPAGRGIRLLSLCTSYQGFINPLSIPHSHAKLVNTVRRQSHALQITHWVLCVPPASINTVQPALHPSGGPLPRLPWVSVVQILLYCKKLLFPEEANVLAKHVGNRALASKAVSIWPTLPYLGHTQYICFLWL
ncbi:hypothetical protein AB205_0126510, partial [Aquarana catesbeiana]